MTRTDHQPGDVVRCLMAAEDQFTVGKEYTVESVSPSAIRRDSQWIIVVADDSGKSNAWLGEYFAPAGGPW